MTKPEVTIVVSPRERFSYTRQSLESIYENTKYPFSLVYVDGGSPKNIKKYLETQSTEKGFQLIITEHYLSPNQARNIGLKEVKTKYIVFIDNDVNVAPGWLEKIIKCAAETEATVVCPLVCIGKNLHQKIHLAGGEARIELQIKGDKLLHKVHEKHYFVNRLVADVQDKLQRQKCEFAEFHCMLVKTSIFDEIGCIDEGLLNTREHIDFCLTVTKAGGTIYCEPNSVVTYVPGPPFVFSDIPFFMLRWSDEWELASLEYFVDKWDLGRDLNTGKKQQKYLLKDKYFKKRYDRLGHRRHQAFLKPLIRNFFFGQSNPWLEKNLLPLERKLNRFITSRYSQSKKNNSSKHSAVSY
ncbi:glycosyltransferase family 2 protein [Okeania sp. KiyG1]|uniref:glycosyltransferase family 2 protein n=1 Tax=Okeania sp. KiyG1 TaxID=2720165 RepID=UPI001925119A|nr:glycosyltransferase [Okeania sp. KiyG1]GGA39580.1 glycosyl transferase [Okeania sp. KiyG1]